MDFAKIIDEIVEEVKDEFGKGKVADYIPALANVDPNSFGIAVCTVEGETYSYGDADKNFSIQSISKVFSLTLALEKMGVELWNRVGKEPSGTPFNSLTQLEYENGIPRNPFINAGALVVCDCVISEYEDPLMDLLNFVRKVTDNPAINYDAYVANSENKKGARNAALANFMKSFNNINNSVKDVLNLYFHQCSLSLNCVDLAKAFLFLANRGINPHDNERILTTSRAKRISSIMLTCGLYDESGDFAFRVGMPGKSGVGGGIVATIPGNLAVSVWAPELDKFGNSLVGIKVLELFTTKTGISIF